MTVYYSDHFSGVNPDTFVSDNTVLDKQKRAPAGISHGRMRYQRAQFTRTLILNDVVRMMQFKSSDRIHNIFMTSTDCGDDGAVSVGFYKTGVLHDGALIDGNIIIAGTLISHAKNHAGIFGFGVPDADLFRGKPLWELVSMVGSQAAGEYLKDPCEEWDLTVGCDEAWSGDATVILEAYYTAGD